MKSSLTVLSLCLLSASAFAGTTNNNFDIFNKSNTKTGTATYTIENNKGVLKSRSSVDYLADGPGGVHQYEYRLGPDGFLLSGQLNNMADRTTTFYNLSKAHDSMDVRTVGTNASASSRTLQIQKPEFLIAFPDDPSLWESLIQVAAGHPHTDNIYYLFVPGNPPKTSDRFEPFLLPEPSSGKGLLEGKEITLKHYVLTFHAGRAHLYLDADGRLMQAETPFTAKQVRQKFELSN